MSFSIHAAGSNGFRFSRDNREDEDIFQAAAIMSALQSAEPNVSSAVEGVADYVTPNVGPLDAVQAAAGIQLGQLLADAVNFLVLETHTSLGWISVHARHTHVLWPTASGFARVELVSGDDNGFLFMRTILPALNEAGMNNYGVFRAMAEAVGSYNEFLNGRGPATLLIQLSK
jgi:hypothetical protein